MVQSSFALMTNLGRSKEAAALANGTRIEVTHIAIGDGATVPSGGETALYNEVARKTISGHGTVSGASNVAYFDAFLAADDGPYTIREAGLIDSAGDLIAIAHYDPAINKPVPASGQTVEGTIRLEVAFSDVANVTIKVDPAMLVALQRLTVLPWIPIISISLSAPPASPVPGDTYVIAASPTGSWSGHAGKVAEYTLAGWAIIAPPDGHGVSLPDGKVYVRIAGVYVEFLATETLAGLSRKATQAEVDAAANVNAYIGPTVLANALQTHRSLILADVAWPSGTFQVINWNDTGIAPDFATIAAGVYTLTRTGTYLIVAQMAYAASSATSIGLYRTKLGASAVPVAGVSLSTGNSDGFMTAAYVIPGTEVSIGDKIEVRAFLGGTGTVLKKNTIPGTPTSISISRIGN